VSFYQRVPLSDDKQVRVCVWGNGIGVDSVVEGQWKGGGEGDIT